MNDYVGIPTPYEDLLARILDHGILRQNRTGIDTRSLFGQQLRYNLEDGFPLITTKKVYWKAVVAELLWFLRGDSNVQWLHDQGVTIWDEWADEDGELGPIYGVQWRSWQTPDGEVIDQIAAAVRMLQVDPDSRRNIVTAWNPADVDDMALPPCHVLFQFWAASNRLHCHIYQRSCDMFLGVPFNIASYALLTHMMADQAGMAVGELVWTGGDCHIYDNHLSQVLQQLKRRPYPYPTLYLQPDLGIDEYTPGDIVLHGYEHHPPLKGDVAV